MSSENEKIYSKINIEDKIHDLQKKLRHLSMNRQRKIRDLMFADHRKELTAIEKEYSQAVAKLTNEWETMKNHHGKELSNRIDMTLKGIHEWINNRGDKRQLPGAFARTSRPRTRPTEYH